jgi:hypothetical protein
MTLQTVTAEQVQAKLAELKLTMPPLPYRWETLFAKLDGWGVKGYIQRKQKLISHSASLLQRMLKPGEEVLYVGKGVYASFVEQYFMGALMANLVNQTVFVLTNLRLIMLHSNTKGIPQHTYWTIYYSQIKSFKASWTGTVNLVLVDGTSLKFSGFEKLDRTQMPAVFEKALADYVALGFNPVVSQSRENVCTHCFELVPKKQYDCGHCQAKYWQPGEIALRSLIFPSWGDFIMGHTSAAIMELIGYIFTWFIILAAFSNALNNDVEGVLGAVILAVILLGFAHIGDACLTYFVARKGLHPRRAPVKAMA